MLILLHFNNKFHICELEYPRFSMRRVARLNLSHDEKYDGCRIYVKEGFSVILEDIELPFAEMETLNLRSPIRAENCAAIIVREQRDKTFTRIAMGG